MFRWSGCAAFAVIGVTGALAHAANSIPVTEGLPETSPSPIPIDTYSNYKAEHRAFVRDNDPVLFASASERPFVAFAFGLNGGFVVGGVFGVDYNGNGLPVAGSTTPSNHTVGLSLGLHGEYLFYNTYPMALGPEVTFLFPSVSSGIFSALTVTPGMVFWYAPWHVPVAIGAAIDSRATFVRDMSPSFDLVTSEVRFAFRMRP